MLALALLGCASSPQLDSGQSPRDRSVADHVPNWAGDELANAPKGPNAPFAYPSAFEVQEVHRPKLLTDEEYKELRDDLVAARERTVARAMTPAAVSAEKPAENAVATRSPAGVGQLTATASN
jgi:hypothetical protein